MIARPPKRTDLALTAFAYTVPLRGSVGPPSTPDPEQEVIRAQFAASRTTGHWLEWFVDVPEEQDQVFRLHGLPRQMRAEAVAPLRKLYSPSVCRRLLRTPTNSALVRGLFSPWIPDAIPLIRIGARLGAIAPWTDKNLLGQLRAAEGIQTALTEVDVWFNLVRFGLRFDREPVGPDGRVPDFAVYFNGWRYIVEVKTLRASAGERLADELQRAMNAVSHTQTVPFRRIEILTTESVRELLLDENGRSRIVEQARDALDLLSSDLSRIVSEGCQPAEYTSGDWFRLRVSLAEEYADGITGAAVWEGPEDERRAVRIASLVEDAALQIPPAATGVPLISVGDPIDVSVVRRVLGQRRSEKPVMLSPIKFVVLRWHERVSPFQFRSVGVAISVCGLVDPAELRLASMLGG